MNLTGAFGLRPVCILANELVKKKKMCECTRAHTKSIKSKKWLLLGSSTCRATVTTLIYMYSLGRELSHSSYMNHSRRILQKKEKKNNNILCLFLFNICYFFSVHFFVASYVEKEGRKKNGVSFIQSSLHLNTIRA